jgi:hypothetical protein
VVSIRQWGNFVLVWLLSKEDIGRYRQIRRFWVDAFWMYSAHAQWYASPVCKRGCLMPQPEELLDQQSGGDRAQEPARGICCGAVGANKEIPVRRKL